MSNISNEKVSSYFQKFVDGVEKLKNVFISRDEEIEAVACGFLTGTNVLLIGEPGTGKSLLINKFSEMLGMSTGNGYFHYLLTKYTEPSEILGTVKIESLKKGIYEINTKNKLPEANLVFLDEVFNANSAILNALLTIINEKKLIIGNMYKEMKDLIVVYGASNYTPRDPLLKAFFDRFPIRLLVEPIDPTLENYKKLIHKEILIEKSSLNNSKPESSEKENNVIFTRNEAIEFAKRMNEIVLRRLEELKDEKIITSLINEIRRLRKKIYISDRSIKYILKMVVAHSMLKTRNLFSSSPKYENLRFVLTKIWEEVEQKDVIEANLYIWYLKFIYK